MYESPQKKSSVWSPASIQKKSKSYSKPGSSTVQPKRDSLSEFQAIPSYSTAPRNLLTANIMPSVETQELEPLENATVQRQAEPGGVALTLVAPPMVSTPSMSTVQSKEIGIQRQCSECAKEQQEQSGEEGKEIDEMSVAASGIQTKLTVGAPGDPYEQEADRVAGQVMSMPDSSPQVQRFSQEENPVQMWSLAQSITPLVQRQEDESVQMRSQLQRSIQGEETQASGDLESRLNASKGGGSPLSDEVRSFMEPRFGTDFSSVRVHTGGEAVQMNQELGAQAFTHGSDIYFGAGKSPSNNELTAHELTHVVQQTGFVQRQDKRQQNPNISLKELSFSEKVTPKIEVLSHLQSVETTSIHEAGPNQVIQRTIGDGHDLTSPRFSRLVDLEAAYDNETVISRGASGRGVQAIQQALYDIGFRLPGFGADGKFGPETVAAVRQFQTSQGLSPDGRVGPLTMAALDARFPAVTLPIQRSDPWTERCVLDILCPWSPHTVDVLSSRITLKSFDDIFWEDEMWNGSSWEISRFDGGGYNTGTEIGILNGTCEEVAEILYHEVLHAEQPTTQTTTLAKESYAYRIGEEFSIAMGLGGRPALRSTDAQGREFADPTKVDAFVSAEYPSVAGGGEEILRRLGAGPDVEVRRANGTIYVRPANVGEKVPDRRPPQTVNEVTHNTSTWTC